MMSDLTRILGKQIGKLRANVQRIATCSHLIPHVKWLLNILWQSELFLPVISVYIFKRLKQLFIQKMYGSYFKTLSRI